MQLTFVANFGSKKVVICVIITFTVFWKMPLNFETFES